MLLQVASVHDSEHPADSDLNESNGRYLVVLEDEVDAMALGDYGADASALPLTMLHRLRKTVKELVVTPVKLLENYPQLSIVLQHTLSISQPPTK